MKQKKRKKNKKQPFDFGRRKAKESEKKKEKKEGIIGRRNQFLCRKINVINFTHVLGECDLLSVNLDVFSSKFQISP